MLQAGEDARFIARRLVILASEDVGMADPNGLLVADAAARAVEFVGLPEAQLNLAHAVVYLAKAPKSNGVIAALGRAMDDARRPGIGAVPMHLRDAHYRGARSLGHGVGYVYPHDDPEGAESQEYRPSEVAGNKYWEPDERD
jgi:putative ATPase